MALLSYQQATWLESFRQHSTSLNTELNSVISISTELQFYSKGNIALKIFCPKMADDPLLNISHMVSSPLKMFSISPSSIENLSNFITKLVSIPITWLVTNNSTYTNNEWDTPVVYSTIFISLPWSKQQSMLFIPSFCISHPPLPNYWISSWTLLIFKRTLTKACQMFSHYYLLYLEFLTNNYRHISHYYHLSLHWHKYKLLCAYTEKFSANLLPKIWPIFLFLNPFIRLRTFQYFFMHTSLKLFHCYRTK